MSLIHGTCAIVAILYIAKLCNKNKQKIAYKNVIILLALQIILTYTLLQTNIGLILLQNISAFFSWLLQQGMSGVEFVFGKTPIFFLQVLCPLVFMSALIGILNHFGILQHIVKWGGKIINTITGMGELESYVPIATSMLGFPQIFLTIKEQIQQANSQQLFTICLTILSSTSVSMLAAYATMIEGKYVVIALILNLFSGLIISALMNPYEKKENKNVEKIIQEKEPFFQMLGNSITAGFNLVLIVAAMVIGFISLITFLNNTFLALFHISFTQILGYLFSPIAIGIGIPIQDSQEVGYLMATKILTNEIVAMGQVSSLTHILSSKSIAMISVHLVNFVNFGSIGIISGTIQSIDKTKSADVAHFTMRLIIAGTLASLLSSAIVGIFF